MACVSPIEAYQLESGDIVFAERGKVLRALKLPCGQCHLCRLERSRQWATRVMHESQMHLANSYVTLTYDDAHLPINGSLRYRDFQLFMKRLRKHFGPVRFYMCGEYGEGLSRRPHYHACLFGVFFEDRVYHCKSDSGADLYSSKLLDSLWQNGLSTIGDVTFDSAAYVARYCMKKVTGNAAAAHYSSFDPLTGELFSLTPEFNKMSLGRKSSGVRGIGSSWFAKYWRDVFPHDYVVVGNSEFAPPRYYSKLLEEMDPDMRESLEVPRYRKSLACAADSSPARLRAREAVSKARMAFSKRKLE